MPNVAVYNMSGEEVGRADLPDSIFGIKPNIHLMHQAVVAHLANRRQGTQSALTRAEVSGGGRKPWRQKGTGHARQGSIRSPQWRHGGVVFAPKPRSYKYNMNKKVARIALKSAFASKLLDNEVLVLDQIDMTEYRTQTIVKMLNALNVSKKAMMVLSEVDEKIIKSSRNIPGIKTSQVNGLNVYDIVNSGKIIILKESIKKIEEVYA